MAPPLLYLFDIDGTLLVGATAAHREAFAHAVLDVYGVTPDLNGMVTAGRTDSWILAEMLRIHGFDERTIRDGMARAFALMEEYVEQHPRDLRHTVLPGAADVLRGLAAADRVLGLLTGNLRGIARAKLRQAGIDDYFATGGFGEVSQVRADLVPAALIAAGQDRARPFGPDETVLVGDTPLDVEAGHHAGARVAAVATGRYTEDDLRSAGADVVFPTLAAPGVVETLLSL